MSESVKHRATVALTRGIVARIFGLRLPGQEGVAETFSGDVIAGTVEWEDPPPPGVYMASTEEISVLISERRGSSGLKQETVIRIGFAGKEFARVTLPFQSHVCEFNGCPSRSAPAQFFVKLAGEDREATCCAACLGTAAAHGCAVRPIESNTL